MKKSMKLIATAACAVAMTAAMVGGAATSAYAQQSPTTATVTYGQTATVNVDFNINNGKPGTTVSCNKLTMQGANVTASVKSVTVNAEGTKATIALTVKGIDANWGRNNITTINPVVVVDGKEFTNKVSAKVTCLQAAQKVTVAKSKLTKTVKKSTVKKKAVSIALGAKSTSGAKVQLAAKAYKKPVTAKKGATKLTMKKHVCVKSTKKHTIKVKLTAPATRNYKAAPTVTKTYTIKMK